MDEQNPANNQYVMGFVVSENATLYAMWKPSEYTVTYDANGGTGKEGAEDTFTEPVARKYDEKDALYDGNTLFAKENKDFKGWGTNRPVMTYEPAEQVKNLTDDKEITLYAIWTNYSEHNLEATTDGTEYEYNGIEQVLPASSIIVKDTTTGEILTLNQDYELAYANNINAGDAVVTVKPIGNYTGNSTTCTYKINGIPWTRINEIPEVTYNFGEHKPEPEVFWDATDPRNKTGETYPLVKGKDYEVAWSDNAEVQYDAEGNVIAGAKVTVTGLANFNTGVPVDVFFKINPLSIDSDQLQVTTTNKVYTGAAIKQEADGDLTVKYGEHELVMNRDFEIDRSKGTNGYDNNIEAGTATVYLKGIGNFTCENSATFQITKETVDNENTKISVTLNPNEFTYDGTAKESVPTVKLASEDGEESYTLVKNQDYTVEYADNVNVQYDNGQVKAGAQVIIKGIGNKFEGQRTDYFTINPATVTEATGNSKEFTGNPITLEKSDITVKAGELTLTADEFDIVENSWNNNTQIGEATFKVTGKGNYTGTVDGTFKITGKAFTSAEATEVTYAGDATPNPEVTVKRGDEVVDPSNYDITFDTDKTAGTHQGKATVRENTDYAGSEINFEYTVKPLEVVESYDEPKPTDPKYQPIDVNPSTGEAVPPTDPTNNDQTLPSLPADPTNPAMPEDFAEAVAPKPVEPTKPDPENFDNKEAYD